MNSDLLHVFQGCALDLRRFLTKRVRCEHTAADLAQEKYLRLVRIEHPQLIHDLRTYVFKIAANLAIDHLRMRERRRVTADHDAEVQTVPDIQPSPEEVLLAKEELRIVEQALGELSPTCRTIFVLNRFEGLPHGEIAARMGVCRSTVEKNIARALNHCRRRLEKGMRCEVDTGFGL